MRTKLSVDEFAVLRKPLESGRQSPQSLGAALILSAMLQALVYYLTYDVAAESTIFPNVEQIQVIHFWITASIVVLSVLYTIPAVYNRSQKMQYLLTILGTHNIASFSGFLICVFIIGAESGMTEQSLLNFTTITLLFGAFIFLSTSIRFYILLKKGKYRKDSKKGEIRDQFELKNYLPMAIIVSGFLIYIIQYLIRAFGWMEIEIMSIVIPFFIAFFLMMFVLPEQLVILYCKFRYKSFNFDRRGYLESEN